MDHGQRQKVKTNMQDDKKWRATAQAQTKLAWQHLHAYLHNTCSTPTAANPALLDPILENGHSRELPKCVQVQKRTRTHNAHGAIQSQSTPRLRILKCGGAAYLFNIAPDGGLRFYDFS